MSITYLGGPTAVLELAGLRLLTDPTFDPPGEYPVGNRKLVKLTDRVVDPAELGRVDAVLLSHDQHVDNLDRAGREYLGNAPLAFSTPVAAERLGKPVRALRPWESTTLGGLRLTAVPAQHGPDGTEHLVGPVTGFVLAGDGLPTVYVSGDNASLRVVEEIAGRVGDVDVAVLFAGGAHTPLIPDGEFLTLNGAGAAEAAEILRAELVVPLHFEGWAHFTEGADALREAFEAPGLADRLHLPKPGETVRL